MILDTLPESGSAPPVLVIGAGPAGIVQALELRRHGLPVTMLAGGGDGFDPKFQALADAEIADPRRHAPMQMAVRRALGGTSLLWGGRCVPFDPADFAPRDHVPHGRWPLSEEEIRPWYAPAMAYLDGGDPEFSAPVGDIASVGECRLDRLERWSGARDLRQLHRDALAKDPGLRVHLGAVATGIELDPVTGRVTGVRVARPGGGRALLRPRAVVLACGGLETTRLLLASRLSQPLLFGGPEGSLGRYYMGHLEGRIADIVFAPGAAADAFGFYVDCCGRYARRRITIADDAQQRHGLLNMAAWPDNPALADPAHRSAILSLAYLALATPGLGGALAPEAVRRKHLEPGLQGTARHVANMLCGMPEAVREAAKFLHGRYIARPRLPGFFIANKARRYAFFYHAEQMPNPDSRVTLTDDCDALGMKRLRIDLRYGDIDAASVLRSHAVIDRDLRAAGIARLDYTVPQPERHARILDQATDGYHQIGTARMSDDPRDGVVDRDCRVHGAANLFVASSAVFPTSGQANPTLLLSALSARLAAHVAQSLAELPATATPPTPVAELLPA